MTGSEITAFLEGLPVNATDLAVFAILLISAILAFFRGMVHELLSISAWIGAALVTLYAFDPLRPVVRDFVPVELLADVLTGVGVFVVSLILFSFITNWVADSVRDVLARSIDRSLGFLFGIVRGAVLVCLAYLVMLWVAPPSPETPYPAWVTEAKTLPLIKRGADVLSSLAPGSGSDDAIRVLGEEAERRQKALDVYTQPPPQAPAPEGGKPSATGYSDRDRRRLDQLYQSQQ